MSQMPWTKWFCCDWLGDRKLGRCSPSTRGIWADAVMTMIEEKTDRITGTDAELARDCRCTEADILSAHDELKMHDCCDCSEQNGCKTWVCRRLHRQLELSQIRRSAAEERWKHDAKEDAKTYKHTHASSASASASASEIRDVAEKGFTKPTPEEVQKYAESICFKLTGHDFCDYYESVGWMVGKKHMKDWRACVRTWKVKHQSERATKNRSGSNI